MKFKIHRNVLHKALQHAKKFVEAKHSMPILGTVVIWASEKDVKIHATDLEIGTIVTHSAEVSEPGKVCVPAKKAADLVKKMKGFITVESTETDYVVFRSEENGLAATVAGSAFDEFPLMPYITEDTVRVPIASLARSLKSVFYAMSRDETRYNLNGVCIEADKEPTVRVIATDGHRLAVADAGPVKLPWEGSILVPHKAVKLLLPLLKGLSEVDMVVDSDRLYIASGDWSVVTRLIEGEFPNWRQVVPKNVAETIQVDRAEFSSCIDAVAEMSAERSRAVKFTINGDIVMTANNPDLGDAEVHCSCERANGQPELQVAFNATYLIDAVRALGSDKLHLEFKDGTSPVRITERGQAYPQMIVMPMRV